MKNKHLNFTAKNKSRQTRGFTIAAGICLIAIGVAAWAAYDSVVQEPQTIDSPVSISETQPSATPTPEPAPTPTPESDTPTAAGTVSSADEEASATPAPEPAATPIKEMELSFPVGQKVVKRFSEGELVYSDTMRDWRVHNGVDFEADTGEAVKSMADGVVKEIVEDASLGNVVIITHGDTQAWYCGLEDKVNVEVGQNVKLGDELGIVGECPVESADGPHFHLELHQDEKCIDPLSILMTEES